MSYETDFLARLQNGQHPFSICVGDTDLASALPAPTDGKAEVTVHGVRAAALYRPVGEGMELGVTLENAGSAPSPQVHDIGFLDLFVPNSSSDFWGWGNRRVLYSVGSPTTIYDFQPREEDLARPEYLVIDNTEPRSSVQFMPYFCYSTSDTRGVVLAIGWSGRWKADFRPEGKGTRIRFTYDADFFLHPGESVELPRVLIMPWSREPDGDRDLADVFVRWRRLMRDHVLPKQNGEFVRGKICLRAWGNIDQAGHTTRFENMKRFSLPCDAYGVDAGWYDMDGNGICGDWFQTAGDWHEGPDAYPEGMEWLSHHGRAAGAGGFWLWFEFERAVAASGACKTHPEFYIGGDGSENRMIDMRSPAARNYLRSLLYPMLRKTKMTIFRIDFNIDPTGLLAGTDTPGRRGLGELQYYAGLYSFFARLLQDFPALVIDNCASGGRRLDYRMCGLSIPIMCRSDYFTILRFAPEGVQAQTVGLSRWLPNHGDSCGSCSGSTKVLFDTYLVRSSYGASFGLAAPDWPLSQAEGAWYKKILDEAMTVKDYMTDDFYPLTGYSLSMLDWCAFQTCEKTGSRAMVMAFRRPLSKTATQVFALRGLTPGAVYEITTSDGERLGVHPAEALAGGFAVTLDTPRSSVIFFLKKV